MEDASVTSSEEETNMRPDEESDEESDADNNDNPDDVSFIEYLFTYTYMIPFTYMYMIIFTCECNYVF